MKKIKINKRIVLDIVRYIVIYIGIIGFTYAILLMGKAFNSAEQERFEIQYSAAMCKNPNDTLSVYGLRDWKIEDGMLYIKDVDGSLYIYNASNCYIIGMDSVSGAI